MKFDVLGLLVACSYALDCVEAELIKVTNNHSKRVAYLPYVRIDFPSHFFCIKNGMLYR